MTSMRRPNALVWTAHARAKMNYYRLSPARVRRVLNAPKRVEEGVAPKTIAAMQPASMKISAGRAGGTKKGSWTQEIWVMVQDTPRERRVISAWRYPGVTKPRGDVAKGFMKKEYSEFLSQKKD